MCQFMSSHDGHVNVGLLLARTEPYGLYLERGIFFPPQREAGEIMDASWRQRMPTMKG